MRFLIRSLFGLALLAVVVGLLIGSGGLLVSSLKDKKSSGHKRGGGKERAFAVNVQQLEPGVAHPVTLVYGEVVSGQTLELRTSAPGAIVQLSPNFQEGGSVKAGELLFQTDPANQLANLALAKAELAEAVAELADAKASLELAKDEVKAAQRQEALRKQAVDRQVSLKSKGVGSGAAIENAELAASTAEQSVLGKRLAVNQARARLSRAEISQQRKQINLQEAERKHEETKVYSKFPGVLTEVSAVLGGLVNANERLGRLIDPDALEVSFSVSNQIYSHLIRAEGGLSAAKIDVVFGDVAVAKGVAIDRVGAAVEAGQTGRQLFSLLKSKDLALLRPGDFVSVRIKEAALENVVTIPATAVSSDSSVLIVSEDLRLTSQTVDVLRWQKDQVIVRGTGLSGKNIVVERAPQLGEGIKVEPRQTSTPLFEESKSIDLSAAERQKMKSFVENHQLIPEDRKKKILERLSQPKVPAQIVERLRSRMSGN